METIYAIVVLLAVAVIVLLVRLVRQPGAGRAANQEIQKLCTIVGQLNENISDQLTPRVRSVEDVAKDLHRTLQSPNRRGQWAERSLTKILEDSGLRLGVDYELQLTVRDGDSRLKPDAVVFMPKGIKVVIDAKAVWDSYQEAHAAETDKDATPLLERHAAKLLETAEDLRKKDYSGAIGGSPDFVLMFVPADPIVDAAMKVRPTLWEQAWRKHEVLIATPGTLIAFLRTVALAWQEHEINENAHQIAALGKELYGRLNTFAGHLRDMGEDLDRALNSYNKGVGSLQRMVLPQARRFTKLGAVARTEQLNEPELVQGAAREVVPER